MTRTSVGRWLGLAALLLLAARAGAAQTVVNPHGPTIGACANCHAPESWTPARIAPEFEHALRTFPLEGAHQSATCTSCHASLDFAKVPATCASCHQDVHRSELGTDCARCHTPRSFTDQARLARLHEENRFPLRGAHVATTCEQCHTATAAGQPQYVNRSTTCVSCHRTDYDRAATPPHAAAGFPTDCATCHTEAAWLGAPFDHQVTAFPLTGAHGPTTCASCHADGVYRGKPTTCVSCHQQDHASTLTPPHAAAGFATTCTDCHTTTAWRGAPFDHATTAFPLTGGHQPVACATCHADGVYRGKPTTCVSCHQQDYATTTTPPHAAAGFATTCATCHNDTQWRGAPFDHQVTQFPLVGAHQPVACATCHSDGVYRGKAMACVSCHQQDYDQTTTPGHVAAGFGTDCTTCHNQNSWPGAGFDHNTTQFPLAGAHLTATCASCHADGVFRGKPTTCVSCHQQVYATTTTPPHAAAGFSTDCASCHTDTQWEGAVFNHGSTDFPLAGAHQAVSCLSCHADGVYDGKPTTCVACHQQDYSSASPDHAGAGYSTDCTTCHTMVGWEGATFDHGTTAFPLVGAHQAVSCLSCHADGVYNGKPTTCISCHQQDYSSASPSHAAAGYSTDCTTCHTMAGWEGATFNHGTTEFPLTGAHQAVSCNTCHADGVYNGKPTTCVSCHQQDYTAATPNHASAGFSTECAACHTTAQWEGAVFNHTTTDFPLTGAHQATSCASCHADGVYNGKPTTCISCHQQDYATATPNHPAAMFPTTCASCHTTSQWDGATFNHDAQYFPIYSGNHKGKWSTCTTCHISPSNFSAFTCTTSGCHSQSSTNNDHQGVNNYQYVSTACLGCHPKGN